MKDFFDVVLLSKQFAFDEKILATAIQQTFANRNTLLNASPSVFEPSFPADEHIGKQWRAFLKKGMKGIAAENFESVIADIRVFLQPVIEALVENRSLVKQWPAAHGNNDKRRPSEVNHSVSKWKSDNRVRSIFCAMYN